MKKIIIAGGGISGLSAAYRLAELSSESNAEIGISLVEKSQKAGGVISTQREGDFIIEEGPDSVLTKNPSVIQLAEKLGIEKTIIPTREENRTVYILRNGKLVPLPEGFYMMAPTNIISFLKSPLFTVRGKARICMEPLIPKRKDNTDESLYSFVTRRFGREALERVVQPLLSGIYTADPKKLSLKAVMPQFTELEERYGSVLLGLRKTMNTSGYKNKKQSGARYGMFVSFREGMETLVNALASSLPDGSLECGKEMTHISSTGSGWKVTYSDNTSETSDGVILALPSHVSSRLIGDTDPELGKYLGEIEYLSSSVVNLVYRKKDLPDLPRAFGVLVPAIENRDIIAFSFLSEKLESRADSESVIIRCFLGGDLNRDINRLDNNELISVCKNEVNEIFGGKNLPVYQRCKKYERALPLYGLTHTERVEKIFNRLESVKGLALAGNAYKGIGIPDCITTGARSAEKVFNDLTGN